jgi:hypothetical protein
MLKMKSKFLIFHILAISFNLSAINAPTPTSPSNGASFSRFDNFVSSSIVTGAKGYQFQFDSVSNFNSPWVRKDTSTYYYVYTPELRVGKTYFWRVRCYDLADTSPWSATWSFSVINGNTALNSPSNNSTGPIASLNCNQAGYLPNIQYIFEADTAANLSSINKIVRTQLKAIFADSVLFSFGRTVYWRAKTYNSFGDTFGWSPIWKYTIHQVPALNANTGFVTVDPRILPNWTNAGLSSIHLQLDTNQNFNTPKLIEHFLPPGAIQDTLKNLFFGKDYFYRIRAVYKGKVSAWSFNAPIRIYANGNITSPTNGSTVGALTPSFSWRILNGTQCQLQLFEDSARTIVLKDTITNLFSYNYKNELKLNKWYNYRIRYLHALDTAAWLQANFKIYSGQVNLGTPSFNSTNVAVRPRFNFRKQTWTTNHVMEIDTGSAFGTTPSSYFIRIDSFKYDGSFYHYLDTSIAYNRKYVWRVYAIKGFDTAQATVSNFTTAIRPLNYFPPNNYIGTGPSTNGLVTGISGSHYIQWELDSSITFASPIKLSGQDLHIPDDFTPQYVAVNFPSDLRFKTKYFWRTRCINPIDTSSWSNPFNFLTTQDVWLTSPTNNSTNVAINPKLEWGIQGSVSELRFQYQLGTDSNFTITTIVTLPVNTSPNAIVTCMYGTQYYWRARAFHTKDTSRWSAFYTFKTINPPSIGAPVLISPANATVNVPVATVTLSWNFLPNALTYDIEVATDQLFTSIAAKGNTINNTILFSGTQAKTRYYWRVRGRINEIVGAWSTVRWFETAPPTGTNEIGNQASIKIYPNPTHESFKIEFEGDFTLKVYDTKGSLIIEIAGKNSAEINSNEWHPGIYFINLHKGDQCYTQKIVIQ